MRTELINIENLTYFHPSTDVNGQPALKNVSLKIEEGEYIAIIGANGSGKTTLARHMNALLVPINGNVRVAGKNTHNNEDHQSIRTIVGMVFQHPEDQIVATTVEEDIAFGPENLGLPVNEINLRIDEALAEVGMSDYRQRPPHLLSAGQMQRVALAGVLAMRPRCIILDEVTSMLDPVGRRDVRAIAARLHQQGLTVVAITHFMDEVVDADRVILMNNGEIALDCSPIEVFSDGQRLRQMKLELPMTALISERLRTSGLGLAPGLLKPEQLVQALISLPIKKTAFQGKQIVQEKPSLSGDAFIEVRGLEHEYLRSTPLANKSLRGVNMQVSSHSAHALLGSTGSGKSTLLQHLNGLLKPQQGYLKVGNYLLHEPDADVKTVRQQVGLVFQNPEMQFFEQYVGDEIAYAPRQAGLKGEALRQRVAWAMNVAGLDFNQFKDRFTITLSGGEQRKVALASIIAQKPKVLLLDEPLAGLDPFSRNEILGRLQEMKSDGTTLVFSSHQMDDVAVLAEYISVMDSGKDVLHGGVEEIFGEPENLTRMGLEPPVVTRLVAQLNQHGWRLPQGVVKLDHFIQLVMNMAERPSL